MTALFTIGHSNHAAGHFTSLLTQHEVELLVDVRSVPHSRFSPQFNKSALEQAVNYLYLGRELGGRPREPEYYDDAGRVRYDLVAATEHFTSGIQRLIDEATTQRVAIMCAEENPARCHRRRLICPALDGFEPHHIRGDGRVEIELPVSTL